MAYAAVISLKHNVKHPINNLSINPTITKSLFDKLSYLEGLLQALDVKSDQRFDVVAIKALDAEIRKAVWKLEDAFESCAINHSNNGCQQIQTQIPVEQEIRSFIQTVEILGSEFNDLLHHPLDGEEDEDEDEAVSPIPDFDGNKLQSTTIPFPSPVDKLKEIAWELIDTHRGIKVVTLVGMAGIGKTHFATQILQHQYIVETYDLTAWVRVGQRGRVKDILAHILAQIERKPRNLYLKKNMYAIALLLRKNLDGKTCLVVLDDIWSDEVCHDIIGRLADAGVNRVFLTTRLRHINKYELSKIFDMWFLDNEESWDLLWKNVFPNKSSFPPQLEKVGRKIAASCEGLPLLILVIARLLSVADKTEEYWEKVANRKTTTFVDAYEKIAKVLFSSYEYLPEHLKACFLYMGVFPQSYEIPIFKLITLLIAEDFLEPKESDQTLDDFGIECVKKLVSNSLVIIRKQSYDCMIKSCKLHSAYWYLCVKEARKNKFLHVLNKLTDGPQECIENQRRLSVQNSILFGIREVYDSMADASTTRSLLCTGEDHEYPVPLCLNLILLRVLDAVSVRLYEFPEEVVKLVLLRYLSLTHNGKLPPSISNLKRLQCLIIRQHHNIKLLSDSHATCLPNEIWDMQQLKHIRIMGHNLPDPSYDAELPNLETLHVNARSCTQAVLRGLPNLKKLGITIELEPHVDEALSCFEHIGLLDGLESFKCVVVNPRLRCEGVPPPHHLSNLPRGLKKVSLSGLGYAWKYITAISSLPDLKVLKLRRSAFQGAEWKIEYEDLWSLEILLLEDIDLVQCSSGVYKCFQSLQRLTVQHCFKLKTMPLNIGVLRRFTMEVVDCSPSLVASAKEMEKRKIDPKIVVNSSWSL